MRVDFNINKRKVRSKMKYENPQIEIIFFESEISTNDALRASEKGLDEEFEFEI